MKLNSSRFICTCVKPTKISKIVGHYWLLGAFWMKPPLHGRVMTRTAKTFYSKLVFLTVKNLGNSAVTSSILPTVTHQFYTMQHWGIWFVFGKLWTLKIKVTNPKLENLCHQLHWEQSQGYRQRWLWCSTVLATLLEMPVECSTHQLRATFLNHKNVNFSNISN